MKEIFQKEINAPFSHLLNLPESGFYSIVIKASVKPGWRNKWWRGFKDILSEVIDLRLDDEDLRVEIDGLKFEKPNGKKGLFNSPAAFSGTKTLGKIKTVVFLIELKEGTHTVSFIPERSAYLESLTVEKLPNQERLEFYPETKAEDDNYYSWYTFALVNRSLKSLSVSASANISSDNRDDDDLKVVVDGMVRKNPLSRHKDSLFCGFTLKGREYAFTEELNLGAGIHYIELFADKTPTLNSVKLDLSSYWTPLPATGLQPYRSGPNGEDYNRFDTVIKDVVGDWNKDFLSQASPPPKSLDPNLVKAMIYVESTVGYGYGKSYPAYPDVMQVGNPDDPAIHTLRNDGWIDPGTGSVARENELVDGQIKVLEYKEAKADKAEDSIKWGIRWLYHKAQRIEESKRHWFSWEQAVKNYNGGGDPKYFDKVYRIYREGTTLSGFKLWFLLGFILLSSFAVIHNLHSRQGEFFITRESLLSGKRDFQFSINVLSGLRLIRYPVSKYFSRGGDFLAFYKPSVEIRDLGARPSGVKVIAVTGRNISDRSIVKILEYNGRGFKLRRNIDEFGSEDEGFDGDSVLIGGRIADEEQEIEEWHYLKYINAPDQRWESTYYFDGRSGVYQLKKQTKNNLSYEL